MIILKTWYNNHVLCGCGEMDFTFGSGPKITGSIPVKRTISYKYNGGR